MSTFLTDAGCDSLNDSMTNLAADRRQGLPKADVLSPEDRSKAVNPKVDPVLPSGRYSLCAGTTGCPGGARRERKVCTAQDQLDSGQSPSHSPPTLNNASRAVA